MAKRLHRSTTAIENHVLQRWEVAHAAERLALVPVATDLGGVARQADDGSMWACVGYAPPAWIPLGPEIGAALVVASGAATARSLATIAADASFGPGYSASRLPSFPATGITWNSAYRPNFHPDSYASTWGITKRIWVSRATGNDTTGTGTIRQPYKTVTKAWAIIQAGGDTAVQVVVKMAGADVLFYRDEFTPTVATLSGKRVYVTPDDASRRIYATTAQSALSWTLTAAQTYTYEATRAAVSTVLDMSVQDAYGIPAGYTYQSSIATVEANPGSWWQSGSLVYVHTFAGTIPVEGTTLVCVNMAPFAVDLGASAEVFLRNVQVMGAGGYAAQVRNVTSDYTANKFVAWGCSFAWASQAKSATANGLTVEAVKAVQLFNCVAAYNSGDGFNFHYTRRDTGTAGSSRDYYALGFGCVAYDNGIGNSLSLNTNNGFTSHEGAHFLGVDCRAWNCVGPLYAMVNGCNSVLVGCVGNKSAHSDAGSATHAAFYFDNSSAPSGVTGAAYLEDCIGDDTVYDLSSDGSTLPITLRRFIGSKIPVATQPYVTVLG